MTHFTRRHALGSLVALVGAASATASKAIAQANTAPIGDSALLDDLGMTLSAGQRAAGVSLLQRYPSIDTHSHPGRFFLKDLPYQTPTTRSFGQPFEKSALADLQAGNVSAALFAAVADMRLLEMTKSGGLQAARDFQPGEAYSDYKRQIGLLKKLLGNRELTKGLNLHDVGAAHDQHKTAAIFAVEGGDFIENKLDRIHEAFSDGVRAITLVHYHVNQIGDIQTAAPVHQGLTPLGKSLVKEMNRAGILIDLAHAPFSVARAVVEISTRPAMVSHTNLLTPSASHPRLISAEHAKLVAGAGGIIGSWPSGVGQATFADYIDSIQRLVDTVGIDHVAIGTDMDANYKPVLRNYRDWSLIPAALLARGLHEAEVAKVVGGNFLRIFKAG